MGGQHPGMDWHDAGAATRKAEKRDEWRELVVRPSVAPNGPPDCGIGEGKRDFSLYFILDISYFTY